MRYPDVDCPYCNAGNDICHDDGYGYEEDVTHEQECGNCGKRFTFRTHITFFYEAHKADCLNGAPHKFEPTRTCPKFWTRMRCADCNTERPLTEQEWFDLLEPMEVVSGWG